MVVVDHTIAALMYGIIFVSYWQLGEHALKDFNVMANNYNPLMEFALESSKSDSAYSIHNTTGRRLNMQLRRPTC